MSEPPCLHETPDALSAWAEDRATPQSDPSPAPRRRGRSANTGATTPGSALASSSQVPVLPVEGRSVVLRDIRLDDLDDYAAWHMPGHLWQEYDGPDLAPPRTPEEASREIAEMVARMRDIIETGRFTEPRFRLVVADRTSDRLVGTVSRYVADEHLDWQALGIDIFDDGLWGRGLGHEALGLWVEYQFRASPNWSRLMMFTWSGNVRMARLATSLGFVEEARYRRARWVSGDSYDSLGFGVLREEWESRYPDGFAAHLGI